MVLPRCGCPLWQVSKRRVHDILPLSSRSALLSNGYSMHHMCLVCAVLCACEVHASADVFLLTTRCTQSTSSSFIMSFMSCLVRSVYDVHTVLCSVISRSLFLFLPHFSTVCVYLTHLKYVYHSAAGHVDWYELPCCSFELRSYICRFRYATASNFHYQFQWIGFVIDERLFYSRPIERIFPRARIVCKT